MVQVLPQLVERFGLTICPYVIGEVDPDMTPEPEMLLAYAKRDAQDLARLYDLDFPTNEQCQTNEGAVFAGAHLAHIADTAPNQFWEKALSVGAAYWSGGILPSETAMPDWATAAESELARMGHYLPGTVLFEGEWYWGVDRLDHLETRLIDASFGEGPVVFDKTWNGVFTPTAQKAALNLPVLEYFFSARSPYSYVGLFQARRFADATGLNLRLRPVLPMMMRGMKVPFRKRFYILTDAKREAEKAGLPLGNIADPLGVGVERVYAVAYWIQQSRPDLLEEFFRSALAGIATEAIDVATDEGLREVVSRAGLDWAAAKASLDDTAWKSWVQSNRDEMADLGLWGVPTLRFGAVSAWGQDRFWLIREEILRLQSSD